MTKVGLTEIVCVIDRSGSMRTLVPSVISGFNEFLHKQKLLPGEAQMTFVQFDDVIETVFEQKTLATVEPLNIYTYVPRNSTSLLDAVGGTIDKVGGRLASTPEADRPEKVIFIIQTDGAENSSKEYSYDQVKTKIEHQREKYNWEFIFMGANIDANEIGQRIGVAAANIAQFDGNEVGVIRSYSIATNAVGNYRTTGSTLAEGQDTIGDTI